MPVRLPENGEFINAELSINKFLNWKSSTVADYFGLRNHLSFYRRILLSLAWQEIHNSVSFFRINSLANHSWSYPIHGTCSSYCHSHRNCPRPCYVQLTSGFFTFVYAGNSFPQRVLS